MPQAKRLHPSHMSGNPPPRHTHTHRRRRPLMCSHVASKRGGCCWNPPPPLHPIPRVSSSVRCARALSLSLSVFSILPQCLRLLPPCTLEWHQHRRVSPQHTLQHTTTAHAQHTLRHTLHTHDRVHTGCSLPLAFLVLTCTDWYAHLRGESGDELIVAHRGRDLTLLHLLRALLQQLRPPPHGVQGVQTQIQRFLKTIITNLVTLRSC